MSIPIAARRYISELGLTNLLWHENKPFDNKWRMALLICKDDKKYSLRVGSGQPGLWLCGEDLGWVATGSVLCWAEIKT